MASSTDNYHNDDSISICMTITTTIAIIMMILTRVVIFHCFTFPPPALPPVCDKLDGVCASFVQVHLSEIAEQFFPPDTGPNFEIKVRWPSPCSLHLRLCFPLLQSLDIRVDEEDEESAQRENKALAGSIYLYIFCSTSISLSISASSSVSTAKDLYKSMFSYISIRIYVGNERCIHDIECFPFSSNLCFLFC